MIESEMDIRLVKTHSLNLTEAFLGNPIKEHRVKFGQMKQKFGFNVCGEGGEYETVVFDSPIFKKKIVP